MDLNLQEARELVGRPLHDSRGERLGEVSGVYFSDAGGKLDWVSVAVPAPDPEEETDTANKHENKPETEPESSSYTADMSDARRTTDAESAIQHRFVPAGALTSGFDDRLSLAFGGDVLDNQPHIEPRDGALSSAQVARLHEFFHTFDGHSRITTATEGELASAATQEDHAGVPFTGRGHEPAFGTGEVAPGEPHDVTLQGTGNPAP